MVELSQGVAVYVMGMAGDKYHPPYAKDTTQAMSVVEKLREKFSNFGLYSANGWEATFWNVGADGKEYQIYCGAAESPAEAICMAALEAVLGEEQAKPPQLSNEEIMEKIIEKPKVWPVSITVEAGGEDVKLLAIILRGFADSLENPPEGASDWRSLSSIKNNGYGTMKKDEAKND